MFVLSAFDKPRVGPLMHNHVSVDLKQYTVTNLCYIGSVTCDASYKVTWIYIYQIEGLAEFEPNNNWSH